MSSDGFTRITRNTGGFKFQLMVLSEPGGFNFNLIVTLVIGLLFDCLSLDCAGLNNITGITPDNHPSATWNTVFYM